MWNPHCPHCGSFEKYGIIHKLLNQKVIFLSKIMVSWGKINEKSNNRRSSRKSSSKLMINAEYFWKN